MKNYCLDNSLGNITSIDRNSDLPWHYDSKIEKIEFKHSEKDANSTINKFRVTFDDDIKIGLNYCQPDLPVTDIPIVMTPALGTGLHGRNLNIQKKLSEIGLPSLLIGMPGSERDSVCKEILSFIEKPKKIINEISSISLARNAHYVNEIFKQGYLLDLDDHNMIGYGESRGAMILLGNIACQQTEDINVPYSVAVSPCYIEPFKVDMAKEFAGQIVNEITTISKLLGHFSINSLNTLNLSPKSIAYEISHIPTLFRGDTGSFISKIPKDQNLSIIAFDQDFSGQPKVWLESFPKDEYPNIDIEILEGNHLSLAGKATFEKIMYKFSFLAEQLRDRTMINDVVNL